MEKPKGEQNFLALDFEDLIKRLRTNQFESLDLAIEAGIKGVESAGRSGHYLQKALMQNELGRLYSLKDENEIALANALEAEKIIRKIGDKRQLTSVVNCLGVIYDNVGRYEDSLSSYLEAYESSVSLNFAEGIGHTASNVGLLLHYFGDHDGAISYFQKSLEGWKNAENEAGKANVLVNLALEFEFIHDVETARGHLEAALQLSQKNDDLRSVSSVLRNMALLDVKENKLDIAEERMMESLKISLKHQEITRTAHLYHGLAELEEKKGNIDASLAWLEKADQIYSEKGVERGLISVKLQKCLLDGTSFDEQIKIISQCLETAESLGLVPEQIKMHKAMRKLEIEHGNWANAYRHLEQEVQLGEQSKEEKGKLRAKSLSILLKVEEANRKAEIEYVRRVELKAALQESEKQKLQAQEEFRQKTEFFNMAAHDLRNMTGGILSLTEVIKAEIEDSGVSKLETISELEKSADELFLTFEKMLDTNLIESGRITLNKKEERIDQLVKLVVDSWKDRARKKNQDLVLGTILEASFFVDRTRFIQIFGNILSNAIKYSGWGADLKISTSIENSKNVLFHIADRGPGLSQDDFEKVKAPFTRFGAVPTGGESTHGLGLFIVKQLAALHEAFIRVVPREGGGTIFSVGFSLDASSVGNVENLDQSQS